MKYHHRITSILIPILATLLVILPLIEIHDDYKTIMIIIIAVIALVLNVYSYTNESIEYNNNKLSIEILKGERDITKNRYEQIYKSFKKQLSSNQFTQKLNYNPYDKISFILKAISASFEKFINIKSKYISVAVFYKFDYQNPNRWNRIDKNYFPAYENNKLVIFDAKSLGKYVMEGSEDFYFINDKYKEGVKNQKYNLNNKDKETKIKFNKYGSIIGVKIVVRIGDKEYIHALLTISTYGKKIDNIPFKIYREKLEEKIEEYILPMFIANIESELMQIYLQEMDYNINKMEESNGETQTTTLD